MDVIVNPQPRTRGPDDKGDDVKLASKTDAAYAPPPKTTWESIIGLEDAKQALREALELPRLHAPLYAAYGKRPTKGVVLYGPPGCGKTMLGKAVATSLAAGREPVIDKKTGQPTDSFQYVKGPEVLNSFFGQSEANVRELFAKARRHQELAKYQGVVFIDEADTLFATRGGGGGGSYMANITNTFLAETDGLDETGPLVLLSTNRPDSLDPAVTRDGRVDHKIRVGRPGRDAVLDMFKTNLKGIPKAPKAGDLATQATEALFSNEGREPMLRVHLKGLAQPISIWLTHLINGALVVGIVEKAKAAAIRRDIESKRKKARGIEPGDFITAIADTERGMRGVNNTYVVNELFDDMSDISNIERVK